MRQQTVASQLSFEKSGRKSRRELFLDEMERVVPWPELEALGGQMLDAVNVHLESKGIRIATGTIVDATIIHAPSSTKNKSGERDPAMHSTKKGKQWYFGLKAHIGVDSRQGTVHSGCTSAANVSDVQMLPDLLHGEERKVRGDGGYQGQTATNDFGIMK